MTKCKECGTEISTTADACPKCGAKQIRTSGCAKLALGFFVFVGMMMAVGMCSRSVTESGTQSVSPANSSASPAAQVVPAPPTPGAQWYYSQSADPMGKGTEYDAMLSSSNTVEFEFPYSGPQHGQLIIREHPRYGKDVIFSIERGQILCRSYEDCTVLVRFDDGEPVKFSAVGPADNSTESAFIHNYSRFLAAMQKAKTVRISPPIYQQGAPVFEFDVTGFDKDKFKPKK